MTRVRTLAAILIAVLLAAACISIVLTSHKKLQVSADFERVTGLYTGSGVRLLGIQIGTITDVEPEGKFVRVTMQYNDKYRLPANVTAVIVPPSLIADRYVQFTPVYTGGPVLRDKAHIPIDR